MNRKIISIAMLLLLGVSMTACTKTTPGGDGGNSVPSAGVTEIVLDYVDETLSIGESLQISAYLNEDAKDTKIIWETTNSAVATVENGRVVAVGAGSAVIRAYSADRAVYAECNITVE